MDVEHIMTSDENKKDPNEEMPADEKEKIKWQAEQLLSECESSSPRVYVLEMMRVLSEKSRRKRGTFKSINSQYNFAMLPILALVDTVAHKVWRAPETIEKGIVKRAAAIVADRGKLEDLGLGGETIWLREVESDEVFETKDRSFLLQPRQIREIASDFVLIALQTRLHENWNDARLAVLHAAGELLLEDLEEDIRLIPNRFSEVVEAIDEVLSESDWFNLTKDDVISLSCEVIRRVEDG